MAYLEINGVTKRFGRTTVVDDLTLRVDEGEMVCLLGPSGCGKTTTLRIVAGFEGVDAGRVMLRGADVTAVQPEDRGIGIVFQSYALFPHLTVAQNVGFGLRMRRAPAAEIAKAVAEALRLVRLDDLGHRYPRELSGGQQQRVALARAVASRPNLLLLDEPLSNLDAKLRESMREEIRRIQRSVGITAIFVTHDQTEALAMADRMAVMDGGRIVQIDTPAEIYRRPAHPFIAEFIGQATLLEGTVLQAEGNSATIDAGLGHPVRGTVDAPLPKGSPVVAILKAEAIRLGGLAGGDPALGAAAQVETVTFLGPTYSYLCAAGASRFQVTVPSGQGPAHRIGETVALTWNEADCRIIARPQ